MELYNKIITRFTKSPMCHFSVHTEDLKILNIIKLNNKIYCYDEDEYVLLGEYLNVFNSEFFINLKIVYIKIYEENNSNNHSEIEISNFYGDSKLIAKQSSNLKIFINNLIKNTRKYLELDI
jgi:hypothetical protein